MYETLPASIDPDKLITNGRIVDADLAQLGQAAMDELALTERDPKILQAAGRFVVEQAVADRAEALFPEASDATKHLLRQAAISALRFALGIQNTDFYEATTDNRDDINISASEIIAQLRDTEGDVTGSYK